MFQSKFEPQNPDLKTLTTWIFKIYNFSKMRMIKCLPGQILDTADMS